MPNRLISVLKGPYRHLVGGEAQGRRHEVGDPVDPATPPRKVQEWLRAGIVERDAGADVTNYEPVATATDQKEEST